MSSRSSRLLMVAFIALQGMISLAGPALHALPGFNHHGGELRRADAAPAPNDLGRETSHDCPVCHLHAPAFFLTDADSHFVVDVVRTRPPTARPFFVPPALEASPSPRAPPLA